MPKKPQTQRDALMEQIQKHSKRAIIYADDGAFATAGKVFEETADVCYQENFRRWAIMSPNAAPSLPKLRWTRMELFRLRDVITPDIAPGLAAKIRSALKSCDGAIRHAERMEREANA